MISVLSVDEQVILAATALMPIIIALMNFDTLPRTAPTRFLHKEHHATMADLIQGINTLTTGGTDHASIMGPDIGDITADHSPAPTHTVTEAAAVEDTLCTLLPATTAACATLQPMDATVTPYAVIPPGIVTPHPTLTISQTGTTYTTLQTGANLVPATPTTQHKNLSPGKFSNTQDPQPP